jgi:hypothetical protein
VLLILGGKSMQDEQMQNLEKFGDKTFRMSRDVMNLLEKLKPRPERAPLPERVPSPFNTNQPFVFSGQYTDLCYFLKNPHMAMSEIRGIEDADLREAVAGNFDMAQKEGLISFDREKGTISITERGEQYISNPDFQRAAKNDQSRTLAEMREQLANERDLAESAGLLTVDGEMNTVLTEKGKAFLEGRVLEQGAEQLLEQGVEQALEQGAAALGDAALGSATGGVSVAVKATVEVAKATVEAAKAVSEIADVAQRVAKR